MATFNPIEHIGEFSTFDQFYNAYKDNFVGFSPDILERLWNVYRSRWEAEQTGNYNDVLKAVADNQAQMTPEAEKYLDNEIANQRTLEARQYDTEMRDTSLLSAADQLRQLGLSNSSVIQTGGAASNGVATANNALTNHSAAMSLAKYNQKMQMARSVVGLAGQMASSGIHGLALNAAKNSAAVLSSAAAHSGIGALKSMGKFRSNDLPPLPDDKVGGFYSIFE